MNLPIIPLCAAQIAGQTKETPDLLEERHAAQRASASSWSLARLVCGGAKFQALLACADTLTICLCTSVDTSLELVCRLDRMLTSPDACPCASESSDGLVAAKVEWHEVRIWLQDFRNSRGGKPDGSEV